MLQLFALGFAALYVVIYRRIVRFRVPALVVHRLREQVLLAAAAVEAK